LRVRAAATLGLIGANAKSAIPALEEALQDTNVGVRRSAAGALKVIPSR
jgi:HEAT repeat protein